MGVSRSVDVGETRAALGSQGDDGTTACAAALQSRSLRWELKRRGGEEGGGEEKHERFLGSDATRDTCKYSTRS